LDTEDSTKRCNNCGEVKLLIDFGKLSQSRDGYNYRCRVCESKRFQEYYAEHIPAAERGRQERREFVARMAAQEKACTKCGLVKPFTEFHKDARKRDGLYSSCKDCWGIMTKTAGRQKRASETAAEREVRLQKKREYDNARDNGKRWRERNPEKVRGYWLRYRARLAQAQMEPVDLEAVLRRCGMFCYLCGTPIKSRVDLHIDHVVPLSRGGAHSEANLRPTHSKCNVRKHNRLIEEIFNGGRLF
jgi:5-methylcytosine-specific restriction endonuclease McrA